MRFYKKKSHEISQNDKKHYFEQRKVKIPTKNIFVHPFVWNQPTVFWSLESLKIRSNSLTDLPDGLFSNQQNLQDLELEKYKNQSECFWRFAKFIKIKT